MQADVVFVGAGLANGLIAYRLRQLRPDLTILLFEAEPAIGGEHTWSFHDGDVPDNAMRWLAPFVAHRWTAQEVRFPGFKRLLPTGYRSIPAERFRAVLTEALGDAIVTSAPVAHIASDAVWLRDGRIVQAEAVIDARGGTGGAHLRLAFQKFVGLEIRTAAPHGRSAPLIMDATVDQTDGYRFVYVLPLAPDRLLVEDTYYSDEAALDAEAVRARIRRYAKDKGWEPSAVVREESGVLPLILAGDIDSFLGAWPAGVARVGLAGGLCHPVTGYALPDAVRVAELIVNLPHLEGRAVARAVADFARARWHDQRFLRLLARMLFVAAAPEQRWRVLQRFYALPEPLIERFYAGHPSVGDKIRILSGRSPVPIARALSVLREQSLLGARLDT
jgi:lycopene beta-cyclase